MAHGHPDYWSYSSPQLPVPGIEQIPLIIEGSVVVAAGVGGDIVTYTPVAGEDVFVCGGVITTNLPGINRYRFALGLALHNDVYFDTVAKVPINPSALYRIPSGQTFTVRAFNDDAVAHIFNAMLFAFRVTLVPGAPAPVGLGLLVAGAGV